MKCFVSPRSWVNISVVDLAPVDGPLGELVIQVFISVKKPHEASHWANANVEHFDAVREC